MRLISRFLATTIVLSIPMTAWADPVAYFYGGGLNQTDMATGSFTQILAAGVTPAVPIDIHPVTGQLYSFRNTANNSRSQAAIVNTTSGALTDVGLSFNLQGGFFAYEASFDNTGNLYVTDPFGAISTVNLPAGTTTQVAAGRCDGELNCAQGLAYYNGLLYQVARGDASALGLGASGEGYRVYAVNPQTGVRTVVGQSLISAVGGLGANLIYPHLDADSNGLYLSYFGYVPGSSLYAFFARVNTTNGAITELSKISADTYFRGYTATGLAVVGSATSAVPEPGTGLLFAGAAAAGVLFRFVKRGEGAK